MRALKKMLRKKLDVDVRDTIMATLTSYKPSILPGKSDEGLPYGDDNPQ